MANTTFKLIDGEHVNTTSLELEDLLYSMTRRQVSLSVPVICFIILLMVTGFCGNSLVILTYVKRLEKSSTNLFIFCLAVFDLVNCCISLPLQVNDLLNPYENDQSYVCKTHEFIVHMADIAAGCIIICISFDRYLRIARPHKGISVRGSKVAICIVCITAFVLSSLTFYVYGTETVTFEGYSKELIGKRCGTSETAKGTVVPLLFRTLILFCFALGVLILLTVYMLLGIKVRKWNKSRKTKNIVVHRKSEVLSQTTFSDDTESRDESNTDNANLPETAVFLQNSTEKQNRPDILESTFQKPIFVRELSRSLEENHFLKLEPVHVSGTNTLPVRKSESSKKRQATVNVGRKPSMPSITGIRKRIKMSRTTIMFIAATIAFVASHIPYACTKIALTVHHDLLKHMNDAELSLFKFAEYSFAVSYAANPIIYTFLNPKYRRECKKLLMDVTSIIKCKSKQFYL